jgi:GTPase SAR1 family protein
MTDAATYAPGSGTTINLSLISHTNAGKTTLARTLLGRDVGEVRDAAHVTEIATGYVLVQADDDTLMLWDTPGFGDTARLLSRLKLAGNPIGWFLSQVWDRWRERPLWSSQQAVKNARDEADVILYLVNSAEDPASAAYVPLEMDVLGWVGKPIIVLLNQMGPPREDVSSEIARWQEIESSGLVRAILPLDAFARCWVQEATLLEAVAPLLEPGKQPAMAGLRARWEELNLTRFDASMAVLGRYLARAAQDREAVEEPGWRGKLAASLTGQGRENAAAGKAMGALGNRLAEATTRSTDELIRLHGLSGKAARQVLERVSNDYAHAAKAPEGAAAALGGVVSGAVGGLAADLAAGGLTLGGGMIVGGILGALGATGVAKGLNLARGEDGVTMRWSSDFLERLTVTALLRYLAVAHFGRGRGEWTEGEHPPFWHAIVDQAVAGRADDFRRLQASVAKTPGPGSASEQELTALLRECATVVLTRLYPVTPLRRLIRPDGQP